MTRLERRVIVLNRRGLHARAAARLVETAARYEAEIEVVRGSQRISARSIMGLMMLAASPGVELVLSADGADAEAALGALVRLFEARFDED